ncbi:MAG: Spy/CpxP family protein refolding chaperone [Gemmatimonadaceae bacterium]
MSKIRTAALSAVLVAGFAGFVGAQTPAKPDSAHRGMHDRGQMRGQMQGKRGGAGMRGGRGMRGGPGMRGGRGMRGGMHGGMGGGRMMAGLNLTDAQKARLKTVHEKYQPQLKTLREQQMTRFKALRDARQKGDTSAATRELFQTQRQQFASRSMAMRQQEQNEVRTVLTAEQKAKLDSAMSQRVDRMDKRMKERGPAPGAGRKGKK